MGENSSKPKGSAHKVGRTKRSPARAARKSGRIEANTKRRKARQAMLKARLSPYKAKLAAKRLVAKANAARYAVELAASGLTKSEYHKRRLAEAQPTPTKEASHG